MCGTSPPRKEIKEGKYHRIYLEFAKITYSNFNPKFKIEIACASESDSIPNEKPSFAIECTIPTG